MGTINITGTYTDGATASASTIQTDFNAVETFINNKNISVANMSDDSANFCLSFVFSEIATGETNRFVTVTPSGCTLTPLIATLYYDDEAAASADARLDIYKTSETTGNRILNATGGLTQTTKQTMASTTAFFTDNVPLAAGTTLIFKVTETGSSTLKQISVSLWCKSELVA